MSEERSRSARLVPFNSSSCIPLCIPFVVVGSRLWDLLACLVRGFGQDGFWIMFLKILGFAFQFELDKNGMA